MSEPQEESYGSLKGDNITLKEKLDKCEMVGKIFVHYLCVEGASNWPGREELDLIHNTFLDSMHGITH